MKPYLLAFGLAAMLSSRAEAQELRLYRDVEFGTTARVPATWAQSADETQQGGMRFVSRDGSARMAVWSIADRGRSLRDYMREIAAAGNVQVTYSPLRPGWFVLSGMRGGAIFYTRIMRACGRLHHVALEYPAARKRALDALVTRVSRSLGARC
jgi:hypothetical protein